MESHDCTAGPGRDGADQRRHCFSIYAATGVHRIRYPSPNSPIPLIKNEELILLRAEANINLSNFGPAVADIDLVRQASGGLAPYSGTVDQPSLINELLYNKRYSLMYEGGHSWIDYRRYGLTASLQSIDRPGPPPDVIFPTLPIPTAETQPRT